MRRVGKMPVVEFGDLALLIHLMSAGRLRVFDKRASPKDRASRVLIRLEDGRELRLREFGTRQRAWAKLLAGDAVAEDEMVASLGPEAWPAPPLEEFAALIDQPRHLHPLLRHQRTSPGSAAPGSTRSSGRRASRPSRKARSWTTTEVERLHAALARAGRRDRSLRGDARRAAARQGADAAEGPQARGRALPALRHDDRGGLLLRAPDQLLPRRADRRSRAQGPAPLAAAEVKLEGGLASARSGRLDQQAEVEASGRSG